MNKTGFLLHPIFHFLLAGLLSVMLVWFDLHPVEKGFAIFALLLAYCAAFSLGVIAAVRIRRSFWYLSAFAVILLFTLYKTRLAEGRAVLSSDDCDFSVCNTFRFGSNGVWRHEFLSATRTRCQIGTYECRDGTVFLYEDGKHYSLSAGDALREQMKNGVVRLVHMGPDPYVEQLDEANGQWVYSFGAR